MFLPDAPVPGPKLIPRDPPSVPPKQTRRLADDTQPGKRYTSGG